MGGEKQRIKPTPVVVPCGLRVHPNPSLNALLSGGGCCGLPGWTQTAGALFYVWDASGQRGTISG